MQSRSEEGAARPPLPRLVYIGDVPVEQGISGSVVLWRLLQDYPPESLLIVESYPSRPERRLPSVRYSRLSPLLARLARTRFTSLVMPLLLASARLRARSIEPELEKFSPQAVVTVTHGVAWLTAAEVASRRGLPLHLVNHDCWFETVLIARFIRPWLHRQFDAVYRQARTRLCVSPEMADYYLNAYGVGGSVLYPGRAKDCPAFSTPPREPREDRPFTLVYAGGIFDGCASVLAHVADLMAELHGKLVIFSGLPLDSKVRLQLAKYAIEWREFVPADAFVTALRLAGDVLLAIREREMGFNALISFPSKIADYTATGLPIVLYAPSESAAASWMNANAHAGVLVEEGDLPRLRETIRDLAADPDLRRTMGEAALARGRACFSHETVSAQFFAALNDRRSDA